MAPRQTGIKKLKAHLSAYVRRAADGERVLITDRGEVVAELVPHRPDAARTLEEKVLELARAGRCRLAPGFPDRMPALPPWKPLRRAISMKTLQRWRDDDRTER